MTMEPLSVYAINTSIVLDVTDTGKDTYKIVPGYDAETAVDRVQDCGDYMNISDPSQFEGNVFVNGHDFIAYAFFPKSNDGVYLLTCRCTQLKLTKEESLEQVRKGMEKAIDELNKINGRKS